MCEYCKAKIEISKLLDATCKYCEAKAEIMNIIDEKGKKDRSTEISKIGKIGQVNKTKIIDVLVMQIKELDLMFKELESTLLDLKIEILTEMI